MQYKPFHYKMPQQDYLGAEARAVIEADFEEIHPPRPRKNFVEPIKEGWIWIKQRLHRA
ncbi:MAG: hypothetical protein SFT92_04025 [Rickettsiales bacterium]|nr:hypothetical protein [Rickettsiales bacterium]